MSYSLVLDTTTKYLVVGLIKDDQVIDKICYEAWQRQSEFCALEIDKILKRNKLESKDINQIIVSKGPGSYTGVRIALTIAKVWTIVHKINIKTLSSLQSIAGLGRKIAILDARSHRVYVGIYNDGIKQIDDCVMDIDEFNSLIKKYKDYEIVGETSVLGIEEKEIDFCENMNSLKDIAILVNNPDELIPVYLKEAY